MGREDAKTPSAQHCVGSGSYDRGRVDDLRLQVALLIQRPAACVSRSFINILFDALDSLSRGTVLVASGCHSFRKRARHQQNFRSDDDGFEWRSPAHDDGVSEADGSGRLHPVANHSDRIRDGRECHRVQARANSGRCCGDRLSTQDRHPIYMT
jgi:hypothetical protein